MYSSLQQRTRNQAGINVICIAGTSSDRFNDACSGVAVGTAGIHSAYQRVFELSDVPSESVAGKIGI